MICPSCGSRNFKESRQCPRENGTPVCIDCCKKCRYFRSDPIAIACRFYIENPTRNLKIELESIERQIKKKEDYAEYFYRLDRPDLARREEQEANWLNMEKARILKEIKNATERT